MDKTAAFFRVRRACGHVELLPELLPRTQEEQYPDHAALLATRATALSELEAQACVNCYSRDDIGRLVEDLRGLGLDLPDAPTMIGGTDRQTRLARLLRSRKTRAICDDYAGFRRALDQKVAAGVLSQGEAARHRAWCERSIVDVLAVNDPEWWIEHQGWEGWSLVRAAARRSHHT